MGWPKTIGWLLGLAGLLWALLAVAGWKGPREALDLREAHGPFLLHYTLAGADAFRPRTKAGEALLAGTAISGLWEQLDRAERAYRDGLGLRSPLAGERYREVIGIDLQVIDLGESKRGATGDEPQHFDYRRFGPRGPVLAIALSNRWAPPNLTPAHELFHAYQNGYTRFKNRWFTEGTARLAENLSAERGWRNEPLPRRPAELAELLTRSYDAKRFWNRLALLCDPGCDRGPVNRAEGRLCGRKIVRPLLEKLERLDKVAARDRGIDSAAWPEREQRASANDPYILRAVKEVMEDACPLRESEELVAFHRLLSSPRSAW
ncbi:hypothetical protein [Endothiovibrio diazotrophicus]